MDHSALALILVAGVVVSALFLYKRKLRKFIGSAQRISWRGLTVERDLSSTAREKPGSKKSLQGITSVQVGPGREEAFMAIRNRAKRRIVIMGIGMGELTHTALESLRSQAENVSIDLLMIDPQHLRKHPELEVELAKCFRKQNIAALAEVSFRALKDLCASWNNDRNHIYKFRLRIYDTLPTMTMVMIDPEESEAEIIFESFLPYSGERIRFRLKKQREPMLFDWFCNDLQELWNQSSDGL